MNRKRWYTNFYWDYGPFAINYALAHWAITIGLHFYRDGWRRFSGDLQFGPLRFELTLC